MSNEIYKELTRIPTLFEIEIGGKEKIKVVKYDDYMKLKQEIERLNKENKELKEQVVSAIRVNNIFTENKSIIELQAQRYEQELTITKEKQLKEEIERLNNIINELEKSLKERIDFRRKEMIDFEEDIQFSNYEEQKVDKEEMVIRNFEIIELQDTLDKLQELKGSDK